MVFRTPGIDSARTAGVVPLHLGMVYRAPPNHELANDGVVPLHLGMVFRYLNLISRASGV